MNTIKSINISIGSIALAVVFLCTPLTTHALSMFVEQPKNPVRAGDTVVLRVFINTEGKDINTVEGTLSVRGTVDFNAITTSNSIMSLWPQKPSLNKNEISFVGGTPASVYGTKLSLFNIALTPKTPGDLIFHAKELTGYTSDGIAAAVRGGDTSTTIRVNPAGPVAYNELAEAIVNDRTPPAPFSIEIGTEPTIENGKYFVTFYTEDAESGINRYEVRESGFPTVRSGSPYILQRQNLTGTVEVRAIDNAGNARVQVFELEARRPVALIILTLILLATILFISIRTYRHIRSTWSSPSSF